MQLLRERLDSRLCAKYEAGAAEHGGLLSDLDAGSLLEHALDEVVDQAAYLLTLRDKLAGADVDGTSAIMGTWLSIAVNVEMVRAEQEHGPLTADPLRAFVVLADEVGEVCRALRDLARAEKQNMAAAAIRACRTAAVDELIQVMATAAKLIHNLRATNAL